MFFPTQKFSFISVINYCLKFEVFLLKATLVKMKKDRKLIIYQNVFKLFVRKLEMKWKSLFSDEVIKQSIEVQNLTESHFTLTETKLCKRW